MNTGSTEVVIGTASVTTVDSGGGGSEDWACAEETPATREMSKPRPYLVSLSERFFHSSTSRHVDRHFLKRRRWQFHYEERSPGGQRNKLFHKIVVVDYLALG